MKTAPDFRREPIFRGGDPISPVGFVAIPLCLGDSGRVKEGEILRSRLSGRTKLVGVVASPSLCPALSTLQPPCQVPSAPSAPFVQPMGSTTRPHRLIPEKTEAPDQRGLLGGSFLGSGGCCWIYPCPGDEEGFSKTRSLRISVEGRMKQFGWPESPPRVCCFEVLSTTASPVPTLTPSRGKPLYRGFLPRGSGPRAACTGKSSFRSYKCARPYLAFLQSAPRTGRL